MVRPARLKADRVACINRIRGLLAEFGLVFAQGPAALEAVLTDTLEDASHEMNTLARLVVQQAQAQWRELDAHIAWCDERIAAHAKDNADVKKAATLMGIGPITASASVATVGDFKQFRHAAQFGAWIGLTPRQHSSGGKNSLGGPSGVQGPLPLQTKRGDNYLRSLLIQGAKSAVMSAQAQRSDLVVGHGPARALGLAEGRRGAGQQERTHPVGGDAHGRGVRPPACQRQTGCLTDDTGSHCRIASNESITQQASSQKVK